MFRDPQKLADDFNKMRLAHLRTAIYSNLEVIEDAAAPIKSEIIAKKITKIRGEIENLPPGFSNEKEGQDKSKILRTVLFSLAVIQIFLNEVQDGDGFLPKNQEEPLSGMLEELHKKCFIEKVGLQLEK